MGHSSGAITVDLISMSPKTVGLFHQVIVMSAPTGVENLFIGNNYDLSRSIAVKAGCATRNQWDAGESLENILDCLRKKKATELIDIQQKLAVDGKMFLGPNLEEADGVLPGSYQELLRNRRPYRQLIGTTNREFRIAKMLVDEKGMINRQLLNATCILMAKSRGVKYSDAVGRACADEYSKRPFDIADLIDDVIIYIPSYDSGESMRSKGVTVYKYSFEYNQIGDAYGGKDKKDLTKESPYHAQDLVYVMGLSYNKFTEKDERIRQIYSGMIADFIKTGDPSPPNNDKWQPTDDRNNYFKIDFDDNMTMPGNTNGYHASAVNFWTKIVPEIDESFSKLDSKKKSEHVGDQERSSTSEQQMQQLIRQNLPFVREETKILGSTKSTDWQLLFWLTISVLALLAVFFLVIFGCTYCQRSKYKEYERLSETSRLNLSPGKSYGFRIN